MRLPNRLLIFASTLGLAAAGFRFQATPNFGELRLDFWNVPAWLRTEAEEDEKTEVLKERLRVVTDRIHAKNRVSEELLAGRLTLRQAAARFRDLKREPPDYWQTYRLVEPACLGAEEQCRQVIDWTATLVGPQTPKAVALRARLEEELEGHRRREGKITLPE